MKPLPEFRKYQKRNIVTADKPVDDRPSWDTGRCWMNIPEEKFSHFAKDSFLFDCRIEGERYVWCAPVAALKAVFEEYKLHQSNKDGNPYEPYPDYRKGLIYGSPSKTNVEVICQLTRIYDGDAFEALLKSY